MFAYVESGSVVKLLTKLPPTFKAVRAVAGLSEAQRLALGLYPVVDLTPAFDPLTTRLANRAPSFSVLADRVELMRTTEPIAPAEIAARQEREALRDDPRAVELRDKLRAATPQQISDYVDAQVTDLASARLMFKRLLIVLALLSR